MKFSSKEISIDAFLYVKVFQNFLIRIVEDLKKNSYFANVANMLQ